MCATQRYPPTPLRPSLFPTPALTPLPTQRPHFLASVNHYYAPPDVSSISTLLAESFSFRITDICSSIETAVHTDRAASLAAGPRAEAIAEASIVATCWLFNSRP